MFWQGHSCWGSTRPLSRMVYMSTKIAVAPSQQKHPTGDSLPHHTYRGGPSKAQHILPGMQGALHTRVSSFGWACTLVPACLGFTACRPALAPKS